jgi:hypothetical protein
VSDRRFLVSRPYPESGVGSNVASLAGAVWLARETGRTLVVDWRGTVFLQDKALNYFTEFFDAVPEILGVPVLYAPSADAGDYDEPGDNVRVVAGGEYRRLRELVAETSARHVVLTPFHPPERVDRDGDPVRQLAFTKEVYRYVAARADLRAEIEAFYAERVAHPFVVGLNVATGNGAYAKGTPLYKQRVDTSILEREKLLLGRLERAVRRCTANLPRYLRDQVRVFYATDSSRMSELLSRLPNSVTRRTIYPPPGSGRYFNDFESLGTTDRANAADIVADMFLLARCNALVRNFSMFNYYGTVMTDHYGGNLYELESFFPVRHFVRRARKRVRREFAAVRSSGAG